MDLLDRLLGHDAWTTQQLLWHCRAMNDEQLDRDFDLAHRTVRRRLRHIIGNMECWGDIMAGQPPTAEETARRQGQSVATLGEWLERAADQLARVGRAVAQRHGWDEKFVDFLDDPPREKSFGGALAHIITHSMHHRAQLLYMLRRLGAEGLPEGDVLSWEYRRGEP